ncbi:MAG TPA: (d)CMP kinase [Flavobacteriaceae bacterium]|nr:(d)CMP kinase [Flavobacteriaceae bacterium]
MEKTSPHKKIIIAIDGFSSTGKSTVAKQLAKHLGYLYVDTGAMYRAVTLFAMRKNLVSETGFDREKLIADLPLVKLDFNFNSSSEMDEIHLNDENVEKEIRHLEVAQFVSQVAAIHEVREKLVEQQQKMGTEKGIVMDGRDIGTVVFPEAELKIFMNASPQKRAMRRYKELLANNDSVTFEEVLENVQQRDTIDTTRKDSPLKKAEDAIEIDNSELSENEQFETIRQLAEDRIVGRI